MMDVTGGEKGRCTTGRDTGRTVGPLTVSATPEGLRVEVNEYHAWPVAIPWAVLRELEAEWAEAGEAAPAEEAVAGGEGAVAGPEEAAPEAERASPPTGDP